MDIWKTLQSDEGIKELEQKFMGLESTFKFKCRQCGKCCKNQNTILFSPKDVFKIAKKIGKSPSSVVRDYTEVYIGPQSRIPVVHLLMQGKKNACPFLTEEGRCSIHDAKPMLATKFSALPTNPFYKANRPNLRAKILIPFSKKGRAKGP